MEPVRVLIADDHTLFRDGLRALLQSLPNVEVIDEAADGKASKFDPAAQLAKLGRSFLRIVSPSRVSGYQPRDRSAPPGDGNFVSTFDFFDQRGEMRFGFKHTDCLYLLCHLPSI